MEKIIITILLVNIEVTIIEKIIFELENMMHLLSISLQKRKNTPKYFQIENDVQICIQLLK